MLISDAQAEMNVSYAQGAPGVFVSGLVWIIAGAVWAHFGATDGFVVLFLGGILIFPASVAISRGVFRAPRVSRDNPLERLGLESTFTLFAAVLIVYRLLSSQPELAFPVMAILMGARYFVFRTIYGSVLFWILGGSIAAVGCLGGAGRILHQANVGLIVGVVELGFSVLLALTSASGGRRSRK